MPQNENCFTFIWKIKNFTFCLRETTNIKSPPFFVHEMGGTKWYLCLKPNSSGFKSCVACGIVVQETDMSSYKFAFDYELSIIAGDGSIKHSEVFLKKLYNRGYEDWSAALYVKSDDVFTPKSDMFIPDDFLTIRCRIWDIQYPMSMSGRCCAETSFETNSISVEGKIENFSHLEPKEKYPVVVNSYPRETFISSFNLCIAADGKLSIEIESKHVNMYRYKIYIRDVMRNKVQFGQGDALDFKLHCAPLTISKKHLMKNQRYYLSSDVLTVECKVTFPTGKIIQKIGEPEYGFEYEDTQDMIANASSVVFSEKQCLENLTTLKDDLTSLFTEGVLCDIKLKTDTETFPAHTVVLSARSPVFQSMFTTDMKEKTNNCVEIDDLDADTVRRMLLFMYSANLDDLEFESAKSLYFAADKYNIVSLFQRCSDFLRQNLLKSNCLDILLLADIHQDKDLKSAVQDYIAVNDEVILSGEWKHLEKSHPQLTIEALRTVCMKNRRS